MSGVRTVLGDVPAGDLGVVDAHDHLFFTSRALPGEELDDAEAAAAELRAFAELGGGTVVQWSPFGTRRRIADTARISRETGVHVVAATGLHQARHYDPALIDSVRGRLAELFVAEITEGIRTEDDPDAPASPHRAGLIKVAGDFHGVTEHARWTMTAAAQAHHATGVPIAIHHELGTAPLDVLDLLCGQLGVPADRIILGHLNRSPDIRVQREAAASGAFLAFDGPSRANHATDWRMVDTLVDLAEHGYADQLLLGGDTTTASARSSTGGGPGIPHLLRVLRPRLTAELGKPAATALYTTNPARAFTTR